MRFRLDTYTWHSIDVAFQLQGVSGHSLVLHKGCLYVYGGFCADSKTAHSNLYAYPLPLKNKDSLY